MSSSSNQDITKIKDTFIAIASHKLLSPLTIIKWNSEILRKDDQCVKDHEQELSMIEENVKRLEDFSEIMLEISGVVRLKGDNQLDTFNVSKTFEELELEYQKLILENHLKINISIEGDLKDVKIECEKRLVVELFRSIFENAVKYSDNESMIDISVSTSDSDLICKITNTGFGIPDAEKANVYESFYRCSNALKSGVKGYGLSLYLSQKIIEKIKGDISFESLEREKTTFSIRVPIEKK